jgi:hypothetical protein
VFIGPSKGRHIRPPGFYGVSRGGGCRSNSRHCTASHRWNLRP